MIKQAVLADIPVIEDILLDTIHWMKHYNLNNLWNEQNCSWKHLSKSYQIGDFFLYYINNHPAGCMALTDYDAAYWPDTKKGYSLYLHKLAVKREFAGQGISAALIDYAKRAAISRNIYNIRLDCATERAKLRALYEKQGFLYVKDIETTTGYKLTLYEQKLLI